MYKITPYFRMVKVKKTRKVSKTSKDMPMTVPELRRSFEHITTFLHKGASVSAFRKEWKKVFGTELSEKVASEYIDFVKLDSKKGQRGGAALLVNPASLGYSMTPGTGHPSVPAYVAGGMGLPADSVYATCGKNPFLPPAASTGSNLVGGKRALRKTVKKGKGQKGGAFPTIQTAFSEFLQRPLAMGSPPTIGNDMMMLSKGYNQFASPRPEIHTPNVGTGLPIYSGRIASTSMQF
jgi:hypothetical protein